jgi:hypothetical protein
MIQDLQQVSGEVTEEQLAVKKEALVVFSVPVQCDDPDCETPLTILAIRISGTTGADMKKERSTWTLHGLICPSEHPVSRVPGLESKEKS